MGKGKFLPKDMHDLEDIIYNPKNAERKRKYESYIDAKVFDASREAEARRIMNGFGESIKIPSSVGTKRPDFKIERSRIVYEITSIHCSERERVVQTIKPRTEANFIDDMNESIEHAAEKDYSGYQDYRKMTIIFIDIILATLCNYIEFAATSSIIKKTDFPDSSISCLIITPMPSSLSKQLAHVAYVKGDDLAKVLEKKLPKEFKIIVI
jgi:hypothetical protein